MLKMKDNTKKYFFCLKSKTVNVNLLISFLSREVMNLLK